MKSVSSIKGLRSIVRYTLPNGKEWEGYTTLTMSEIIKRGFVTLWPASGVSNGKFHYKKCTPINMIPHPGMILESNPKYEAPKHIVFEHEDIFGND